MARHHGPADALSALALADADVADVLAHLVADAREALGADAVSVLAQHGDGLALVATTSHRAGELEMLQAQRHDGPCVAALASSSEITTRGADALVARWGATGRAIVDAGFSATTSLPATWRGRTVAGLNLFHVSPDPAPVGPDHRAYAAAVAIAVVSVRPVADVEVVARVEEVVRAREVVEQAKGVIAERLGLPMDAAYERLLETVRDTGSTLTRTAEDVVRLRDLPPA